MDECLNVKKKHWDGLQPEFHDCCLKLGSRSPFAVFLHTFDRQVGTLPCRELSDIYHIPDVATG